MSANTGLLEAPASIPGGAQYQQLACVDAYDAILNCDYAFVAYKEMDSNGGWRVRIKSRHDEGQRPDLPVRKGKPWFQWG